MARRTLSANELRRLAEAVDGIRDTKAYVVWGDSGPEVTTRIRSGDDVMAECVTDDIVGTRHRLRSITLDPHVVDASGTPIRDFVARFDAMFWSEAAVEKFVLPYYMRHRTPAEVASIRDVFNHPSVYAMLHPPLSDIVLLTSARTDGKTIEALTPEELQAGQ